MKLNLADFLEQENSDIIEQHAFMKNLQKVFAELNELFGETSLDKISSTTGDDKKCLTSDDDTQEAIIIKPPNLHLPSKPTFGEAEHRCSTITRSLHNATVRIDNLTSVSDTTTGCVLVPSKHKTTESKDNYRKELLKQIEEKRRLKKLEDERLLQKQEELEKKISEQRLSMYLEYLQERKSGQFITKPKTNDKDLLTDLESLKITNEEQQSDKRSKIIEISLSESNDGHQCPAIVAESTKVQPEIKNKNILANLNEVRKIMQSDHIEMLENLLNLNK